MADSGVLEESWDLRARRIERWLMEQGTAKADVGVLLKGLCEQLLANGVPVSRATSHIQILHSEQLGVTRIWRPGHKLEEMHFPHGARQDPRYLSSPLKYVYDTGKWLELRIDEATRSPYNIVPDLQELGVRHYVMAPLRYSNGTDNSMSWATDHPDGFSAEQLKLLRDIFPSVNAAFELRSLYRIMDEVMRIYAGRGPGERILSGQVRRGDVTRIDSAMLFCDMRDFTALSSTRSAEDLVWLLNDFYDRVLPPIVSRAGEILKFLGDGVLAIFPAGEEDQLAASEKAAHYACAAAREAAGAILEAVAQRNAERPEGSPEIEVSIALHYGAAAYGNIGSGERLDFTIIGRDVNLTSRISGLCSLLEQPVLMSEDFSDRLCGEGLASNPIGSFELKGIDHWTTVYGPADAA